MEDITDKISLKEKAKNLGQNLGYLALKCLPPALVLSAAVGVCAGIGYKAYKNWEAKSPEEKECIIECRYWYNKEIEFNRELRRKGWSRDSVSIFDTAAYSRRNKCLDRCEADYGGQQ